jgi:hypothetical protein
MASEMQDTKNDQGACQVVHGVRKTGEQHASRGWFVDGKLLRAFFNPRDSKVNVFEELGTELLSSGLIPDSGVQHVLFGLSAKLHDV